MWFLRNTPALCLSQWSGEGNDFNLQRVSFNQSFWRFWRIIQFHVNFKTTLNQYLYCHPLSYSLMNDLIWMCNHPTFEGMVYSIEQRKVKSPWSPAHVKIVLVNSPRTTKTWEPLTWQELTLISAPRLSKIALQLKFSFHKNHRISRSHN